MSGIVVGIIGKIRSGKSSLSQNLSQNLNWPHVSFGDEVRRIAKQRGLELSREVLQDIGQDLVENRAQEFCEAVLAQAEWQPGDSLIVDGIRHLKVVEILRELVRPSVLQLVYVKTADRILESRLAVEIKDGQDLESLEHHSTEVQVGTVLPTVADLIVDGASPMNELITEIRSWLDRRSSN
jgi:adenylate kinase family enzyme